jgi:protocatechuate 3,4-dioxygenase beta subunit
MYNLLFAIILTATLGAPSTEGRQIEKSSARDSRDTQQPANTPDRKVSAGSIKGRVIGTGGRAVANASISAFPVNLTSNPQAMMSSLFRPMTTDEEGYFQLTGLQPGAYHVYASAIGCVLSDTSSQTLYRPGDTVSLTLVKGGVITGKVTNTSGEPVVGAVVRAIKIRGIDNKPGRTRSDLMSQFSDSMSVMTATFGPFKTDDRGIYRIYGLEAGYYQVAAGGRGASGFDLRGGQSSAYDGDAATYFPSSTIDTAAEVIVRAGDESTNIDIRYRDNRGHSLSGIVSGSKGSAQEGIQVFLTRASNGIAESTTYVFPTSKEKGFAFEALLDGAYFVTAMAGSGAMLDGAEGMSVSVSSSRRVTISGSDVTGVELVIEPLASIAGRALIETAGAALKAECKAGRRARIEEVVVSAKGESGKKPADQGVAMLFAFNVTTPNEKGEFTSALLRPGVQRLEVQLPGENHYVKSMTLPPSTSNGKPIDAAKNGMKLKSGDKVKGLVVTISEGAAGLIGKVVTGKDKVPPSVKMRVHLVPAEPEAGDEVLRYYESDVDAEGGLLLTSLAPGKYWVVAREVSEQEDPDHKPLAWDEGSRTALRFEGEGTKKTIELSACQRVTDFVLSYTPLSKPSKSGTKSPQ